MPARKKRRHPGVPRRLASTPTDTTRSLRFQRLESRQLLAGDVLADITGLWVTVGNREYFTSDQASVTVEMYAGETLQVTGIRYGLDETYTPQDGVIAFESYVRREHGAAEIGSYDYTDGRFGDPIAEQSVAGQVVAHPGLESGWELDTIDNRIAVVAIRYFGDESAIEDRMYIDLNVVQPAESTSWTEALAPVSGNWEVIDNEVAGDSLDQAAGLTVIETGAATSQRFEVGVKAKTVQDSAFANGFVVVDYRNENDFVYAGLRLTDNQWVVGHFDGEFNDLASLTQDIQPRQVYDLRVAVDGSHVALAADGVLRVSHDFDRPLDQGQVGLANQFAYTHFTEFNVFDNSTPQEAYEQASIAAQQTQQASDAAIVIANDATQVSVEADATASTLESASGEANTAASTAVLAHAAGVQAVTDTQQLIQLATTAIQSATFDQQTAAGSIQEISVTLADAEQAASALMQENEAAQQTVNELAEQYVIVQQAADEAVTASEIAAIAATDAREASDAANLAYDESDGLSKKIRKALQRVAREADSVADAAEADAQAVADTAASALADLQSISDQLGSAQQAAEQTAQSATDAENVVVATRESLDSATNTLNAATQTIQEYEAVLSTAEQQLPELLTQVQLLDVEATQLIAAAELASQEAATARAAANLAASEAETATAEASRLTQEAEAASQALAAAELALQEAIAAEQAAIEQGDASRVYSVNFNNQDDGAFETVAGTSDLLAGQLHLAPGQDSLAVSVLDDAALPERTATRMYATIRADALPGLDQNGFIVFDYQSPDDFKYAGARAGSDKWVVGEAIDGQLIDVATLDDVIGEGPAYGLQAWIHDNTITLLVEGEQKLQHTFDQPIDDGQLGLASQNARSRFDQVAVMQLHAGAGDAGIENDPAANDEAISELF